jgi:hypothetical protein
MAVYTEVRDDEAQALFQGIGLGTVTPQVRRSGVGSGRTAEPWHPPA